MLAELVLVSTMLTAPGREPIDAILKTRKDRKGRLVVGHRQIEFIRDAVNTGDLKRIAQVISPTGIKSKFTWYPYAVVKPEIPPDVTVTDNSRSTWLNWAKGRIPPESALAMTGLYEFCRYSIPGLTYKWVKLDDRTWAHTLADFKSEARLPIKLYPIWYIRLSDEKGRLWIKEYGYGSGEGE